MKKNICVFLCYLIVFQVYAQKVVGVYRGNFACKAIHLELSMEIEERPDKSLDIAVQAFKPGSKYQSLVGTWYFNGKMPYFPVVDMKIREKVIIEQNATVFDPNKLTARYHKGPNAATLHVSYSYSCKEIYLKYDKRLSRKLAKRANAKQKAIISSFNKAPLDANAKYFDGIWFGAKSTRGDNVVNYCLVSQNKKYWLEVLEGSVKQLFILTPKIVNNGEILFETNFPHLVAEVKINKNGFDNELINDITLYLKKQGGRFEPSIKLSKPVIPIEKENRYLLGSVPERAFEYRDWQQTSDSSFYLANVEENTGALKSSIDALYVKGGWKCLSQSTVWVSSQRSSILTIREGTPGSLNMIYSPFGNQRLIYRLSSSPSSYKTVDGDYGNFPIIVSTTPLRTNLSIHFSVKPNIYFPDPLQRSIPVTVFTFGRAMGDYGNGCEYYATKQIEDYNKRMEIIQNVVFAYLFEYGRKISVDNKAVAAKILFEKGRDEFIKNLLKDFMPGISSEDLDAQLEVISFLLNFKMNMTNLAEESLKMVIQKEIKAKFPKIKTDENLMNFWHELYKEKLLNFGLNDITKGN
jgi:hypothetical protein